jgi:hypothetical protein
VWVLWPSGRDVAATVIGALSPRRTRLRVLYRPRNASRPDAVSPFCRELRYFDQIIKSEHDETDQLHCSAACRPILWRRPFVAWRARPTPAGPAPLGSVQMTQCVTIRAESKIPPQEVTQKLARTVCARDMRTLCAIILGRFLPQAELSS